MEKSTDILKLLIGVVVLIMLFLWISHRKKAKMVAANPAQPVYQEVLPSSSKKRTPKVNSHPQEVQAALRFDQEKATLGLASLPLKSGSLTVELAVTPSCGAAQWELLDTVLQATEATVLLSVETLDPHDSGLAPRVRSIPQSDFYAGFVTNLSLPVVKKPTLAGLFICTDIERTGKCGGKIIVDANPGADPFHMSSAKQPGLGLRKDAIYFFKPILLAPSGADIQINSKFKDPMYSLLAHHLAADLGKSKAEHDVGVIRTMNQSLAPLPVDVQPDKIVVQLGKPDFGCFHHPGIN